MELSKEIIKKSLLDEEVTNEEIEAMKTEAFMELMDAINKVNGFTNEKVDRIRQSQK